MAYCVYCGEKNCNKKYALLRWVKKLSTRLARVCNACPLLIPASPEPKKPRLLMWRLLIFILFKLKQITSLLVNSSTHQLINPSIFALRPGGLVVHNAAAPSSTSLREISCFAGTEEAKAAYVATDVVFKKTSTSHQATGFLKSELWSVKCEFWIPTFCIPAFWIFPPGWNKVCIFTFY